MRDTYALEEYRATENVGAWYQAARYAQKTTSDENQDVFSDFDLVQGWKSKPVDTPELRDAGSFIRECLFSWSTCIRKGVAKIYTQRILD